jgi:4,5-dihydroxyphthalate decarboxylase
MKMAMDRAREEKCLGRAFAVTAATRYRAVRPRSPSNVQPLKTAIGNYGLTRALKDGMAAPDGVELDFVSVDQVVPLMRRMVRALEFDVCEMAFTTYLCAKAAGKPFTAIPVFVTRNFHHWAVFHNVKAGIRTPRDLEGRTVGVSRGYTVTTGLWVRGILASEYAVDLKKVTWAATDDEHVSEYRAPANVTYAYRGQSLPDLLASGALAAAVGDVKAASPDVLPLIPDARAAGFAYYRKTGIYPINHTVVIKDAVLAAHPGVATALIAACAAAKNIYRRHLDAGKDLTAADQAAIEIGRVVGDPFPFGIAANRKALDAVVQFAVDQQVIPRSYSIAELFAPGTIDS